MSGARADDAICVVIPARDEAHVLGRCLAALAREQKEGRIDRIIVVDNNSSDETLSVARRFTEEVLTANGAVSAVRNAGAAIADTRFLAFVDADVVVEPGWGREAHAVIQRASAADRDRLVFGATCGVAADANWIAHTWFRSLASRTRHDYVNSGNLILSKALFDTIGGFDEALTSGEDVDLCRRARLAGGTVAVTPGVAAVHLEYPGTLGAFFARERWHGRNMINNYSSPWQDKALLFAMLHIVLLVTATLLAFSHGLQGLLMTAVGYLVILAVLVAGRIGRCPPREFARLALLYSIYGFARALALAESVISRLRRGV